MNVVRHTMAKVQNLNRKHKTLPITSGEHTIRLFSFVLSLFFVIAKLGCWMTYQYIPFRSSGNIIGAIDWHSYSQLILRPYGKLLFIHTIHNLTQSHTIKLNEVNTHSCMVCAWDIYLNTRTGSLQEFTVMKLHCRD